VVSESFETGDPPAQTVIAVNDLPVRIVRMHIQDALPRDAIPRIDDPVFGTEFIGNDDARGAPHRIGPPLSYRVDIRVASFGANA